LDSKKISAIGVQGIRGSLNLRDVKYFNKVSTESFATTFAGLSVKLNLKHVSYQNISRNQ